MPADPVAVLLELIERYGVECHAIGWHRARYDDAVPGHLREARDGARAMIEARLRALAERALAERALAGRPDVRRAGRRVIAQEREPLARLEAIGD